MKSTKETNKKEAKKESAINKPLPRIEREDKEKESTIPLVSAISNKGLMKRATFLLSQAKEWKAKRDEADAELTEIKTELAAISNKQSLPGFRFADIGFYYHGMVTRFSFSQDKAKALMLEHNIDPSEIRECYTESKPFLDAKITILNR